MAHCLSKGRQRCCKDQLGNSSSGHVELGPKKSFQSEYVQDYIKKNVRKHADTVMAMKYVAFLCGSYHDKLMTTKRTSGPLPQASFESVRTYVINTHKMAIGK